MKTLAKINKPKVLDMLTERLSFERSSVKLYEELIERMRGSNDGAFARTLEDLAEHRNEEKEHEEWLEDAGRAPHLRRRAGLAVAAAHSEDVIFSSAWRASAATPRFGSWARRVRAS